ncbi:nitrate regulatory gene2 protein [Vigna radiata var. radiata]|uniref:Nitrate regulatory gene2 protein n=1 Tax=Vigna radiata var. radiata TaxID=3916 RepID=A0A1S3U8N4_VIGRR|nr:nitrate regulatory gene2 protein [Vigna radiata var. radiata]XP_014502388.1 nitrate regulatory gene2 protein [Vigna radiata var. radiata]
MGCVFSSIDEDEKVGRCKERKRLMKQLVKIRGDYSDSLLAYLKSLRNTGATLRQFTESDTIEFETASNGIAEPACSSPKADKLLPPPLPPFLTDKSMVHEDEILETDDINVPPLQIDPSLSSLRLYRCPDRNEMMEPVEEDNWEETKTEFEDEDAEAAVIAEKLRRGKQQLMETVDENSSAISLYRKDATATPVTVSRCGKTLEGIGKELDDQFLKASGCIKEIAVLIDISGGDTLLRQNSGRHDRKRGNSAKVFSVLSWSRHSKSPPSTKDCAEFSGHSEPCKPGAHCATLKRLYAAEKKLFKAVKEEGIVALEFDRKMSLLQKQEDENLDMVKIDKTRSCVEKLESDLISLRQCISDTTSSILEMIDEELLPQLVALTAGLVQMWRTMREAHEAQILISQQLSSLSDSHNTILNSEYHHQATIQFQTEASYWYSSFCKLVKSQREYVRILHEWIKLTESLRDGQESSNHSSVLTICEQWEHGLNDLPEKATSDAIKSLLSCIRSIASQQTEEHNILKKLDKLERKFQKCMNSLAEMQQRIDGDIADTSPRHPIHVKKTETEEIKKQVENERANYLDAVRYSRAMTLDQLQTTLPPLFQLLMEFSSASSHAIQLINAPTEAV